MNSVGEDQAVAPLAALVQMRPETAFTPVLQQQVIAMARLGANVPDKLTQDDVRTVCRTLLFQLDHAG